MEGLTQSCRRVFGAVLCVALAGLLLATVAPALAQGNSPGNGGLSGRNFDARLEANNNLDLLPTPPQSQALDRLERQVPGLTRRFDPTTGVTRTLSHPLRPLTAAPAPGASRRDTARAFVEQHVDALGLSRQDLNGMVVTDEVPSRVSGTHHLYYNQTLGGIPVYNGQLQVNLDREGRIVSVNNSFLPNLNRSLSSLNPTTGAERAVAAAAQHLGLDFLGIPKVLATRANPQHTTLVESDGISLEPIRANLMLLPINRGNARLVWNFQIRTLDEEHWWDVNVDAVSGKVWTAFDWVSDATYRVFPRPVESPNHGARALLTDPANPTASPLGWHDTGTSSFTTTQGNNVRAYDDRNATNNGTPVSCGASLSCDFALNLSLDPSQYIPAAVANLFYWNNTIHDVQYQYGFDEAAGNFQENNFGNGGSGSDSVNAEAQDGSGTNNANFATPPDGSNPRMQMFIWTAPNPDKDGDLDSGIVIHEYSHGTSTRQVGGPANSSCLNNSQQPGEGWSDWFSLAYTAEAGDQGTDTRGIGTYALDQPTTGPGIRVLPYSTDNAVNNWTYESIAGMSVPHGVGSVWAQGIWEVYWALVAQHGFVEDISQAGPAGNQRAMLYVNEGLKFTACSPTFLDTRDGIIQAAQNNFGGEDVCTIWAAFAAYGLGTDASTGGSNSTTATNGFSVPAACQCSPQAIADAGPDQNICLGDSATVGTPARAGHSYSWSPGGQTTAQITVSPLTTTTYTVTASTACGSAQDSATVCVDDGSTPAGLNDDFEGNNTDWSATGLWHDVANSGCAAPQNGFNSPVTAFYYGQDATCNYDTGAANTGSLTSPPISGITATSTLTFQYLREVESFNGDFDRTRAEIVTASGATTVFSLNSSNASSATWTSSGAISLSAFAGQTIQVRFVFDTVDSVANAQIGWFIDDVVVTGDSQCAPTGNTPPSVTITAPPDGTTVTEGTAITFTGTASDAEDGDLTAAISWSSSIDGALGTGGSVNAILSAGTHTITASVTDSGGLGANDSITVTVNQPANTAPTVTITAPPDGTTVTEGTSINFTGTASDAEDGDLTAAISWSSNLDGALGTGGSVNATLSVGTHTVTASVTDSGGLSASDSITVTVQANQPPPTGNPPIDWSVTPTVSYADQDVSGTVTVEDAGATLLLQNNTWRRTTDLFSVGANTVLEFDFSSTAQGEIHGAGFDENDVLNDAPRLFQFYGTQNWTGTGKIGGYTLTYSGSGAFEPFTIHAGRFLPAGDYPLVLINDNDAGSGNNSRFRNVRVRQCTRIDDFEDGAEGWTNDPASTCSTGSFVVGVPTAVNNGGVLTQLAGDHSSGGSNAFFTAPNSAAGTDDVDGGTCIANSPVYSVSSDSEVAIWYFHGQRDAADDPGDGFSLEASIDGGAFVTLASFGDVTVNAAWHKASVTLSAGQTVQFRVSASDAPAGGDLVEAGIDDILVCPN
jgi:extracellular elastinolytic metalloproteinase